MCEHEQFRSAFFYMDVVLMAFGMWIAAWCSYRHFYWLPIGAAVVMVGWFSIAFSLAERVSTALGIEASSPCYSGAEHVGIKSVVIADTECLASSRPPKQKSPARIAAAGPSLRSPSGGGRSIPRTCLAVTPYSGPGRCAMLPLPMMFSFVSMRVRRVVLVMWRS